MKRKQGKKVRYRAVGWVLAHPNGELFDHDIRSREVCDIDRREFYNGCNLRIVPLYIKEPSK